MRAKVLQVAVWVGRQIRALRDLRRTAAQWLRDHASQCLASLWLAGLSVFGGATVHRALAAQVADPPTSDHPGGAIEQVAMLDVDEINGIRTHRMHALGLAAAGEAGEPDARAIQDARAALARGLDLDGEKVATAGKLVVVTRGGIAGWLKRNRGKKADPETLAWLRGEEAAEGRASYAGWADRDDGNILHWVRERRHPGSAPAGAAATALREAGEASVNAAATAAQAEAGEASGHASAATAAQPAAGESGHASAATAAQAEAGEASGHASAATAAQPAAGEASGHVNAAATAAQAAAGEASGHVNAAASAAQAAAGEASGHVNAAASAARPDHVVSPADAQVAAPASPRAPAVQGLELVALGGAAAAALIPRAPVDPSPDELAALRDRLRPLTATGAIAVSVRDHHIALILLCDQLFERAGTALTEQGQQVVRELGHVVAAERGQAYRITVDRDRAFELVSSLAIAGVAPERVEIALEKVDRALDVIEIEWLAAKETP